MPLNVTEYHQDMLDMLKKQELVPSDATIEEYSFLFKGRWSFNILLTY
jgi:hypothetical protein